MVQASASVAAAFVRVAIVRVMLCPSVAAGGCSPRRSGRSITSCASDRTSDPPRPHRVFPWITAGSLAGARAIGRPIRLRAEVGAELGARVDLELAVGLRQGRFDRLRADEERGGDLAVGQTARCQLGDALLGRRQRRAARRAAAERAQLAAGSRGPERRAELFEDLQRLPERLLGATPLVPAPLQEAECEQRPPTLERQRQPLVLDQRLVERALGRLELAASREQQPAAACAGCERPARPGLLGPAPRARRAPPRPGRARPCRAGPRPGRRGRGRRPARGSRSSRRARPCATGGARRPRRRPARARGSRARAGRAARSSASPPRPAGATRPSRGRARRCRGGRRRARASPAGRRTSARPARRARSSPPRSAPPAASCHSSTRAGRGASARSGSSSRRPPLAPRTTLPRAARGRRRSRRRTSATGRAARRRGVGRCCRPLATPSGTRVRSGRVAALARAGGWPGRWPGARRRACRGRRRHPPRRADRARSVRDARSGRRRSRSRPPAPHGRPPPGRGRPRQPTAPARSVRRAGRLPSPQ